MNFRSVDRIISAKDYGGSAKQYIKNQQKQIHRARGITLTIKDLDKGPTGVPVYARIWQGQWIADCECKSASFVDPDDQIFFCFGCGNRANGNKPRPVIFPATLERLEIERLLLERPVDDMAGLTDLERVGMAKPLLYAEVQVIEEPTIDEIILAEAEERLPKPRVQIVTLPLPRSWEPGETIEDLRAQQDEPIRKWKRELRKGGGRNGV